MTNENVASQEVAVETPVVTNKSFTNFKEFLDSLAGAPTTDQIATWKMQAPNNAVEGFTPDGKRAFIMRGLTGLELSQIQKTIQSMATAVSDPDLETQIAAVVKATVWTNVGTLGRLTDVILRTGSAGLPSTLFSIVTKLSDFMDPQKIEMLSGAL